MLQQRKVTAPPELRQNGERLAAAEPGPWTCGCRNVLERVMFRTLGLSLKICHLARSFHTQSAEVQRSNGICFSALCASEARVKACKMVAARTVRGTVHLQKNASTRTSMVRYVWGRLG